MAGIYLDEDGGLEEAKRFIFDELSPLFPKTAPERATKKSEKRTPVKDPKNLLQEYVQKYKKGKIEYIVKGRKGPDHNPTFVVSLEVDGKEIAEAEGNSKKEAEKICAEKGLKTLQTKQKSSAAQGAKPLAVKSAGKTNKPKGEFKAKSGKTAAKKRTNKE